MRKAHGHIKAMTVATRWSPDSKKFAWTEYETIPEQAK